jgi:Flp pilus assembly protein TadG
MSARVTGRTADRGQSTVEFAFVLPLFLLLILGTIEFGWAVYTHTTLMHAAEEGVRRGIVLNSVSGAWTTSGNQGGSYPGLASCNRTTIVGTVACSLGSLDRSRTTAVLDTPASNQAIKDWKVEVRISHQYRGLIIGLFPWLNGMTMTGHAEGYTQ